ncbi:MAG: S1/P1 nuclease [Acidobacteria bacterium]|nr:S1/P1 nuclease [Acidobacteriota bacterium]
MKRKLFLLLFASLTFSLPVLGWNDVGHKLSSYIAWQRLSPAARERVVALLSKAPEDSGLAALYPQDSRSTAAKQREFFMIAAFWADIVRDRNFPLRNKYHRGNWHYSDTFWRLDNGKLEILPNPSEDGGKAVEQLIESEKTLRNATATEAEKAIALAWFLHLAGDIHQPLHTSARVTELEPKGDQGGNLFVLTPKDTPRENQMNLHWFWDSIVNRVIERKDEAADSAYLPPIAEKWMKIHPFGKYRSKIKPGQFAEWQKESFELATSSVFPGSLKREAMPSGDYVKGAFRISEEQITLAGYRMGEMLNSIFDTPATQANADPPCRIIRRVSYPVSKTNLPDAKFEIALLDLCPPNKGMVARPMTSLMINGEFKMFEYDVVRIFKSEQEARDFARMNNIKDIGF